MAESDQHRSLIGIMAENLQTQFPGMAIMTDIPAVPGETPVPPTINKFRPDIYGYCSTTESYVICEAKTHKGLKREHTVMQLDAFVEYLADKSRAFFILGVYGTQAAQEAKTILRLHYTKSNPNCCFRVYDGHSYWEFKHTEERKWHLC